MTEINEAQVQALRDAANAMHAVYGHGDDADRCLCLWLDDRADAMEVHPVTAPACSPPADLPPATASENGMNRPTHADGPAGGNDRRGTA